MKVWQQKTGLFRLSLLIQNLLQGGINEKSFSLSYGKKKQQMLIDKSRQGGGEGRG